ncbi:hypothetical protein [Persicitalea jodogahamensis]|uniref:Glycosyl transferase n=1 Tax=Persicitalea jodogahamensis TaxID=402147 RepID=A0A8J3DAP6_9BACT|nr:hypothetical protein [Persicitalea jodogahamensis]GHB75790.1 hypothetical protein GCM10007390_32030 [Persicitalea jodogahamensis]
MKIAFTVCNRHQLSHALVLAHSLRKHNPDHRFFLGWVDRMKLPNLPDWISIVPIESLELNDWVGMEQRYCDFELVAACKPFLARHLLALFPNCEELAYLSPTTQLYGSIDQVTDKSAFLQLSPQRLRPIGGSGNGSTAGLDDKRTLNTGMYHAGSWIMHPDGQETAMLNWWCDRMTDRGFFDLCEGMCLDQLWLNYLPIYHERVETLRNPGWHYGLHAVPASKLTVVNGKYYVDGLPLIAIDFAGAETYHPIWSDHIGLVDGHSHWKALRQSYRHSLREYALPTDQTPLPYGRVSTIKSNRGLRKIMVRQLLRLVKRIETFDWTY